MLRLTRKFLRFEPGPNLSTEVLGTALKAVPMSLEPCNLAGKRGGVKDFIRNCTRSQNTEAKEPAALKVCRIAQTKAPGRSSFGEPGKG